MSSSSAMATKSDEGQEETRPLMPKNEKTASSPPLPQTATPKTHAAASPSFSSSHETASGSRAKRRPPPIPPRRNTQTSLLEPSSLASQASAATQPRKTSLPQLADLAEVESREPLLKEEGSETRVANGSRLESTPNEVAKAAASASLTRGIPDGSPKPDESNFENSPKAVVVVVEPVESASLPPTTAERTNGHSEPVCGGAAKRVQCPEEVEPAETRREVAKALGGEVVAETADDKVRPAEEANSTPSPSAATGPAASEAETPPRPSAAACEARLSPVVDEVKSSLSLVNRTTQTTLNR